MEAVVSALIGYFMGVLSPAALISKIKGRDLRNLGTGNLGGTNTAIVFGAGWGAFVMAFDALKAFGAAAVSRLLFPGSHLAWAAAGSAAVFGHIFPFYLGFRGGKGLASLFGFILAVDPMWAVLLFFAGIAMMFISDRGIALTVTAALFFPVIAALKGEWAVFFIALVTSAAVLFRHRSNISEARHKKDVGVRKIFFNLKEYLPRKNN